MDLSHPSLRRHPLAAFLVSFGLLWTSLLRAQFPLELTNAIVTGPDDSAVRPSTNRWELRQRGRGIVPGSPDEIVFVAAPVSGDFDVQVRVESVDISNPYVRAGLMLRASTAANAPFAAVFASSPLAGCFAENRIFAGANPARTSWSGGFPSAPPDSWLRLRRIGGLVDAYASTDGLQWTRLGGSSVDPGPEALLGLVVTSQNSAVATRAVFSSFGPGTGLVDVPWVHTRESATPSSRRTGLVFSEIQYHPGALPNGTPAPEFIEIANHGDIFMDLTGWSLDGAVQFRFPEGYRLQAGDRLVVTDQPELLRGLVPTASVLGPWSGSLNNAGDTLRLRDSIGAIKLSVGYRPGDPWPVAADGTGHSLVLASPSFGENDPRAWSPSRFRGGSPGRVEPIQSSPLDAIVINEFLAHTDPPQTDFIELLNRSNAEVDLSGCILTDDLATNRFTIPAGTLLGPRAFRVWDEKSLGFRLAASGESLYLLSPDARRVLDMVRFGGQENGVSTGRLPDGARSVRRLATPTPGAPNSPRRLEPIVINEIFYNPPTGDADEFIELHHRGTQAVDLSGWKIRGGVSFDFPPDTRMAPGDFLVVARDAVRLRSHHPSLPPARVVGNLQGTLGNGGDVVRLTMPDEIRTTNSLGDVGVHSIDIPVGEVRYADGGAWGRWADGGGSSIELMDPDSDPALAANWADSDESTKAPWTRIEWTGRMDNGSGVPNRIHLGLLNDGECLIDDIEVVGSTGTNLVSNPTFENGNSGWLLAGNHAGSTIDESGAKNGSRGLHLRAQGGVDTGVNSLRGNLLTSVPTAGNVTFRAWTRWIAGWPELLFRLRGGHADYGAPLQVPLNLGTPGQPNSRRVPNTGPALYDVAHFPPLPRIPDPVVVTTRVSDADGIASLILRYRVDPSTTTSEIPMRDDGLEGDITPGDGIWSAQIPPQGSGLTIAFTIVATDGRGAGSIWPRSAPLDEGLIRWNEPIPFGSLPHAHLWTTAVNRNAAGANALNNAYRRGTLIYGNTRVLHGVLFRDKGSPFHNGSGDITVRTPDDNRLHGVSERLFSKTGNGGPEETGLRGRVASWLAARMGVPSLEGKHQTFHINGASFANVVEDQEEPDHAYALDHYPDGGDGDLYKISMWFEYSDDNRTFTSTSATLEPFLSESKPKLARYRWNWERRAQTFPESDYTTIFNLVDVVNSTLDGGYADRVLRQADIAQWTSVFAFHRVTGNWDSWTYNVGQNMYLYRQPGRPAVLFPWDIDFVFGLGDGTTAAFSGGQDPVASSRLYDHPPFRRMLMRALNRAATGPLDPKNFGPVVEAYRALQVQNNISGLASVTPVTNYMTARRTFILNAIKPLESTPFVITYNGGNDFTTGNPTAGIVGAAPLRVADIAINGVRYPVNWTSVTNFSILVPLTEVTNNLVLSAFDSAGNLLPDSDSIRVTYTGAVAQARDWVGINEIHYNPSIPGTSFIELFNRHPTTPFNLAGYRIEGLGYTFPTNAVLAANSVLVIVANRAAFSTAFGAGIPVFDEFTGKLDNNGERLALVAPNSNTPFSEVRYLNRLPWATNAAGLGASLQLIDPAQDTRRPANWTATALTATNRTTPGAPNAYRTVLNNFSPVWFNEVVPAPASDILDNAGDNDPFIEIHNPSTAPADISGFWLSDSLSAPFKWQLPAGSRVPAGGFLVVWLDGEPAESIPGIPHAPFRIDPTRGTVVLSRSLGSQVSTPVLDWIEYDSLTPGRGLGSVPDGDPFRRRPLYFASPGKTNNPAVPAIGVVINEFCAQNSSILPDPADGAFDDWIELFNAGPQVADLSGYFLTDSLTNKTASILPPGTLIPAGGFLLVWADGKTQLNNPDQGAFHASFSLSKSGEQIGLFAPDGSLVDGLSFTVQTNDVSYGRFPDGPNGDWGFFEHPTPDAPNFAPGGNAPPRLSLVPNQSVIEGTRWSYQLSASDPDPGQSLRYSLGTDAPPGVEIQSDSGLLTWTPDESQGPGIFAFTVRVTDSGSPARSASARIVLDVAEANRPPDVEPLVTAIIPEGSPFSLQLSATDADVPAQTLRFRLGPDAPPGVSVDAASGLLTWIPGEAQGPAAYEFDVFVNDSFVPAGLSAVHCQIEVLEVDNPPTLAQPQPIRADEGTPIVIQLDARDPESAPVRFSLVNTPPDGLTLDPITGIIRWTPTEAQGPASYPLIVRATETSALAQTAQATFSIEVREVNQRPSLGPIPTLSRFEGDTLTFTPIASDPDLPPQALSFSIESPVPPGASVDPISGRITWKLPDDIGRTQLNLRLVVTDDATQPLSAQQSWSVTVLPRFKVVLSEIMNRPSLAGGGYIELFNPSATTAWDLSGVRISGRSLGFTFNPGTVLEPGGRLCVVANGTVFRSLYGSIARVAGAWTGTVGADGDDLMLIAASGELLDRVQFTAGGAWPELPPNGGSALQLIDALSDNSIPANWTVASGIAGPTALLAFNSVWRYLESPPTGTWTAPGFDDRAWKSGAGLLYAETAPLPGPKNTPLNLGQWSYYFRSTFEIPSVAPGATLTLTHIVDDGMVLYLNGTELTRFNMPDGIIAPNTPATVTVGDATTNTVSLPATLLQAGTNVLAAEVHQSAIASSDIVFGLSLDLVGGALPPRTPGSANSVVATLDPVPRLFINELQPEAGTLKDATGRAEPWIELLNAGPVVITLDGWRILASNQSPWNFPAGLSLKPGERRILFLDGEVSQSTPAEWHAALRPNPGPGWLAIARPAAVGSGIVDSVTYAALTPGTSLASVPEGQSFRRIASPPTPGGANPRTDTAAPTLAGRWNGSGLALRWVAAEGVRYRIEQSLDPVTGWQTYTRVNGAGTAVEIDDPGPAGERRFYRLIVEP